VARRQVGARAGGWWLLWWSGRLRWAEGSGVLKLRSQRWKWMEGESRVSSALKDVSELDPPKQA